MPEYFWRFEGDPRLQDLVRAEAAALGAGQQVAPGLFLGERPLPPGRAGYALAGGELVSRGRPDALEVPPGVRYVGVPKGGWKLSGSPAEHLARLRPSGGRVLPLSSRAAELLLYPTEGEWYLVRPRRGAEQWFQDAELPFRTSTSLPARLARALINIVARPGDEVLDPVCGTGVLLAEAARIGCRVTGGDLNRKAAWYAQKNFASLGLRGDLRHADAFREWQGRAPADVLVGDLPYGIRLREVDLTPFARALPPLARRWALVAHEDLTAALTAAGHPPRVVLLVRKVAFTRYLLLGGSNEE